MSVTQIQNSTALLAVTGVIKRLPNDDERINDECCLCLNSLVPVEPDFRLPLQLKNCGHIIHEHCLYELFIKSKSSLCPLCREDTFSRK